MPVVTTIKLTGENHEDVDTVCTQIKRISDESGVKLRGPIPLPTRKLVVPCRKAPREKVLRPTTIGRCGYTRDSWN